MRKRFTLLTTFSLWLLLFESHAYAALNLELTKGVAGAIPIAIVPFDNNGAAAPTDVAAVVQSDLSHSGEFTVASSQSLPETPHTANAITPALWQKLKVSDVVVGQVTPASGNRYNVNFSLVDIFNKSTTADGVILTQQYTVDGSQLRSLAHQISDQIYQQLTGQRGIFSTRIAYVAVSRPQGQAPRYQLMVADADGYNPRPILVSSQPIMSPSWSPDGSKLAYVSFETYLPQIYVSDVSTGKRQLITSFDGINGAPEWSHDGSRMAVALSKGASNPNIYILNLANGSTKQITNDLAINTEPNWAPDDQSLIYTSDRGGAPQVYQVNINGGQTQRLTYNGSYNATPSYTPDGKQVVFLHRDGGTYNVAILDIASGQMTQLTQGEMAQSPSVAPNGKMVVFAVGTASHGILGITSSDGKINLRLPDQHGSVQEPAWSPFLS